MRPITSDVSTHSHGGTCLNYERPIMMMMMMMVIVTVITYGVEPV